MKSFEPSAFRQQFPLLKQVSDLEYTGNNKPAIVYLDSAATTQKLATVINSHNQYYQQFNANVHRASHTLSTEATIAFEQSRQLVKNFIGAQSHKEIIWTKGATESINLVVQSLARNTLSPGDEIVLCVSEHHANIVPWQIVAKQTGAIIKTLVLNQEGYIDVELLDSVITLKTKFVSCAHISNVLGRVNPIEKIIKKAKSVNAISLIDGAQACAHIPIDVQKLDCDFYVFSAHKMYGPTGVGVLYGKEHLLESMVPYQAGGEMIKRVSLTKETTFNELPFKFEAGTPNIAGIIAFAQAVQSVSALLKQNDGLYCEYEKAITSYCYDKLSAIDEVNFIVEGKPDIGVLSFRLRGHHNHDVAVTLDSYGIAVRSGHHCAMPLMEYLKIAGCLRVSLAAYNTIEEIDFLISCIKKIILGDCHELTSKSAIIEKEVNTTQKNRPNQTNESNDHTTSSAVDEAKNDIMALFAKAKTWDSRHREIMLLGKTLSRMDKQYRDETNLIAGCESLAWIKLEQGDSHHYSFSADSDAKIIRGLLVIVLAAFNHRTKEQIHQLDINEYFDKLGLIHHLSPSRSNGLLAIVDKIKSLAEIRK